MIRRLLYFGYYIKELDIKKFNKFVDFVSNKYKKSKMNILLDIFMSSLRYNISILEYFQFHFYRLPHEEKLKYAGTGYIYEYQLKMNPVSERILLENKLRFLSYFKSFIKHDFASIEDLENEKIAKRILQNKSGKLVLKHSSGQCGNGIEVRDATEFNPQTLIEALKKNGNDFVEEFVSQHSVLMQLSPSGLNTIRIITQLHKGKIHFVAARLRITINSTVDNMAAGNIAAPINLESGIVDGTAVYSDITKQEETFHPVTKTKIVGFSLPFWQETLDMVKEAALLCQGNKSIGWDVAITDNGPELIEGNHDWCKLLWQLPVKCGLKSDINKFIK